MKELLYGLILAGGSGSRLWPMSREMFPKQLLKIGGNSTLFQSTFKRLIDNIDDKKIRRTLDELYNLDFQIKSGQVDRHYALELFLIKFNQD